MNDLNISSLVGFLDRHDPNALRLLQGRYPDAAPILTPGKTLGGEESTQIAAIQDLCIAALDAAMKRVEAIRQVLDRRIGRARKLRLVGNLTGAISTAGVVTALTMSQQIAAMFSAGIAFAGSATAFIAEYLETSLGSSKSPAELRLRLAATHTDLIELEGHFKLAAISGASDEEWTKHFRETNAAIASLREIEFIGGIAVT